MFPLQGVGHSSSVLGQAQKCGSVKPVNDILTLIIGSPISRDIKQNKKIKLKRSHNHDHKNKRQCKQRQCNSRVSEFCN